MRAGQFRTGGAEFPGEVKGTRTLGKNLARVKPRVEVAPKSRIVIEFTFGKGEKLELERLAV